MKKNTFAKLLMDFYKFQSIVLFYFHLRDINLFEVQNLYIISDFF